MKRQAALTWLTNHESNTTTVNTKVTGAELALQSWEKISEYTLISAFNLPQIEHLNKEVTDFESDFWNDTDSWDPIFHRDNSDTD